MKVVLVVALPLGWCAEGAAVNSGSQSGMTSPQLARLSFTETVQMRLWGISIRVG